jgi:hypothetical protein
VAFNGTNAPGFQVNTAGTQITVNVPAGATTGPITVTTPGGTATSQQVFTVLVPPTITAFTPTSGVVGTSVTITGTNFTNVSAVTFNGTNAPGFQVNTAGTQITVNVPAGATTGVITVTTPGGTATSQQIFTVLFPPTITAFTPTSGVVGTSVTITGTNFTNVSAVRFNGVAATFTVNSATQLTATVPAGATTGPITVTTPGGTATSEQIFTVLFPPTIGSFTPTSGQIGTVVTITGTNFMDSGGVAARNAVTAVRFNGVAATFTVNSATQLTATVPTGATTGVITVMTNGGTATSATPFTVLFPPAIASFAPTQGGSGTVVTITGANFRGATSVSFNGVNAPGFTVNEPGTQIVVTVPPGATTGRIAISTPVGSAATSPSDFVICSFAVSPTSFTIPGAGGGGTITVTTQSGCPQTSVSNAAFITITSGATGAGSGTVTFTVAPNPGPNGRTGTLTVAGQTVTVTQGPPIKTPGDFNGDGQSQLIWRNRSTGANSIWLMTGTSFVRAVTVTPAEGNGCWFIGGTMDFTGDGNADFLWRNMFTGANAAWQFSGTTVTAGLSVTPSQPDLNWIMACTGDFNFDGKPDIVFRNRATGAAEIWLMDGLNRISVVPLPSLPLSAEIPASGDFSGDGQIDLLVRDQNAGTLSLWVMNGTAVQSTQPLPSLDRNSRLSAVGDFNRDGKPDIVWRNVTDGTNLIWLMNGTSVMQTAPVTRVIDQNWEIVGPR